MKTRVILSVAVMVLLGSALASAQDLSPCEQVVTNENQLGLAYSCDVFCLPIDPPKFQAWLIDPQFLWADFASLPAEFSTALAESQEQIQGVTVVKARLTRSILTGETLVEFPSSTNTLTLAAPTGYDTNQIDSASRSSLQVWQQYIEWGALDEDTAPALRLEVALADIQDKPAYDAALAAADADCAEDSAMATELGGMQMLDPEDSVDDVEALTTDCSATNAFQVVAITKTVEGSVTIRWNSECNALYRIDYAPSLSTNTAWQTLYDNYPSQGTSTFWTDGGNWVTEPPIDHPSKVQQRFYRVAKTGTNIAPPQVTIVSPTNGVVLSGDVTVSIVATSASSVALITLFVDGEEFDSIDGDQTNLVINTCEWANGPHTLFAVATDGTGVETTPSTNSVSVQYAASPYVTAVFSNYVSRFWFSQPFFEPELGETQQISAVFTTNSNWTLTILDASSNAVRTVTGTGATMNFAWDGTGDGGSSLAAGLYDFAISATTTGFAPLEDDDPTSSTSRRRSHRVRGKAGTFGIAYQGHHPNPTIGSFTRPSNGLGGFVTLTPNYALPYGNIKNAANIVNNFASAMSRGGWRSGFPPLGNDALTGANLRMPSKGGSNTFNQVNVGLLVNHGIRGSSGDYTISASGPLETYIPIYKTGASNYDWVRLSECDFGGSNLRWMAIFACNILYDDNYQDMYNKVVLPIDDNLHLLLSARTSVFMYPEVGRKWAQAMLGKEPGGIRSVRDAWYLAGDATQKLSEPTGPVVLRVAGWPACLSDQLLNYSTPDSGDPANITVDDHQAYP
jgi:hypothetical protein